MELSENQESGEPKSKLRQNPPNQVDLQGSSAHPMFLGAVLNAMELQAVADVMNPPTVAKNPSFYGGNPKNAMKKEFGSVISPHLLGAAETFAETNHPTYAEVAAACAQRLPLSVMKNMSAGTIH